jgi:hypothetical protein
MRNGTPPAKVTDTTVTKKDNAKMRLRPKLSASRLSTPILSCVIVEAKKALSEKTNLQNLSRIDSGVSPATQYHGTEYWQTTQFPEVLSRVM